MAVANEEKEGRKRVETGIGKKVENESEKKEKIRGKMMREGGRKQQIKANKQAN